MALTPDQIAERIKALEAGLDQLRNDLKSLAVEAGIPMATDDPNPPAVIFAGAGPVSATAPPPVSGVNPPV